MPMLYKRMRSGCVIFLVPPFLPHFILCTVTCNIYDKVVIPFSIAYLSVTAVIARCLLLASEAFGLNNLFVLTFCFFVWLLWLVCFLQLIQSLIGGYSAEVIKIHLLIQNLGITGGDRNRIIDDMCS